MQHLMFNKPYSSEMLAIYCSSLRSLKADWLPLFLYTTPILIVLDYCLRVTSPFYVFSQTININNPYLHKQFKTKYIYTRPILLNCSYTCRKLTENSVRWQLPMISVWSKSKGKIQSPIEVSYHTKKNKARLKWTACCPIW